MLTPHECARTVGTPEARRLYSQRVRLARRMESICFKAGLRGSATRRQTSRFDRLYERVEQIDAQLTALMEARLAS